MTRRLEPNSKNELIRAAEMLQIPYEASPSGEWIRFTCPKGYERYVIKSRLTEGYLTWCQGDNGPVAVWYLTAIEAITNQPRHAGRGLEGSAIAEPAIDSATMP